MITFALNINQIIATETKWSAEPKSIYYLALEKKFTDPQCRELKGCFHPVYSLNTFKQVPFPVQSSVSTVVD